MPEQRRFLFHGTSSKFFGWFKNKPDVEHSLPEAEMPVDERNAATEHLRAVEEAEKSDAQRNSS
jgi:hypothetical protein